MNTKEINKEARILAEILVARRIGAIIDVDQDRKPVYNVTPSTVAYRLRLKPETPVAKVYNLQADFASRINRHRATSGVMADTFVRVDINEQIVEVNRLEPDKIDFADVQWNPRPHTALCGVAFHFGKPSPLIWRLDDSDQPHALVAGTTGSGKTNELITIILSLALHNAPADLRFSLVDMKRDWDLRIVQELPHLASVARDEESALMLLRNFHTEMNQRELGKVSIGWRHMLVIDELATLVDSSDKGVRDESLRLIEDIARKCRSSNMNLLLCTQTPKAELLGGQLRNLLALRLVGAVTSNHESDAAVGIARAGAEMLPGKGAMIYRCGRTVKRFQAPLVVAPALVVRKILKAHGEAAPLPTTTTKPVEMVALPVAHRSPVEQDADKIRQAWQEHKSQAEMIRILTGQSDANTGGANRRRLLAALAVLERATTTTATTGAADRTRAQSFGFRGSSSNVRPM